MQERTYTVCFYAKNVRIHNVVFLCLRLIATGPSTHILVSFEICMNAGNHWPYVYLEQHPFSFVKVSLNREVSNIEINTWAS